jgi:general secretion pathway protein K
VISVIWGLGLIVAIALSLLWSGNISYRLARNGMDAATAGAAAEAAVNRAVLGLLDPRPDRRWRADSSIQRFEFNGIGLKVAIQDELGRIDLNQAGPELLAGLLASAGLDRQSAVRLVDGIVDWRQPTPQSSRGGNDADYSAAGRAYRPRNGAFQSVDELLLVLGMTPELFRRIEPALTVYSGRQFIDQSAARREVLLALPNMSPEWVANILAERVSRPPIDSIAANGGILSLRGRAFAIRTELDTPGATLVHEAVVRLTDNSAEPYWLLSSRTK